MKYNCFRALRCPERTVPDEACRRGADGLALQAGRAAERASSQGRPLRYSKAEDEVLLPLIRDNIDYRQTYGYHRVSAVLNRRLKQQGQRASTTSKCTGTRTFLTCF